MSEQEQKSVWLQYQQPTLDQRANIVRFARQTGYRGAPGIDGALTYAAQLNNIQDKNLLLREFSKAAAKAILGTTTKDPSNAGLHFTGDFKKLKALEKFLKGTLTKLEQRNSF